MKLFCLASVVLAAVCGLNTATAGFVLIDDFDVGSPQLGARIGAKNATFGSGTAEFVSGGEHAFLRYQFDPAVGNANPILVLQDVELNAAGQDVFAEVSVSDGTDSRSLAVNLGASPGSFGDLAFDFGAFAGVIGSLEKSTIGFTSMGSFDATVGAFGLQTAPEPASLALIGLVSAGGGVVGFRKRRKAAVV